jgi:hypothetical protein
MKIIKNDYPEINLLQEKNGPIAVCIPNDSGLKNCVVCGADISSHSNGCFYCPECSVLVDYVEEEERYYIPISAYRELGDIRNKPIDGLKCPVCSKRGLKDIGFIYQDTEMILMVCVKCKHFIEYCSTYDLLTDDKGNVLHNGGNVQCFRCKKEIRKTYSVDHDEEDVTCPRCNLIYSVKYPFGFLVRFKPSKAKERLIRSEKPTAVQLYLPNFKPPEENYLLKNEEIFARCPVCGNNYMFYIVDEDTNYEGFGYRGSYLKYFILCVNCRSRSYVQLEGKKAIKSLEIFPIMEKFSLEPRGIEHLVGRFDNHDIWIDEELDGEFCDDNSCYEDPFEGLIEVDRRFALIESSSDEEYVGADYPF